MGPDRRVRTANQRTMKRSIAFVLAAGMLTACGTATDHVTFQPPPDFKSIVSVGPFMQMWSGPDKNMIMLMALPAKLDLEKSVIESPVKDATVEKQARITICNGQQAVYLNMIGNVKNSSASGDKAERDPQQIEFLATDVSGKTYMAMYIRPKGSPADTSAQSAIHNVCPK